MVAAAGFLLFTVPASGKSEAGARSAKVKIKVHAKRPWRSYGFLPGYNPAANGLDRRGRVVRQARRERLEPRYWHYGRISYGWGYPGFYRGRWNGGSFGPCWTYTPIGMMPNCGP
jgi:hypothetical protein